MSGNAGLTGDAALARDAQRSLRIAGKLGVSLLGTWVIALGVRVILPRVLGPVQFGHFQFADAFTTTVFVFATLGLDTYIRKEVPLRPEHASEFFGGALLTSLALNVAIMTIAVIALQAAGKSAEVVQLVVMLGVAQILSNANALLVAMLHARGTVNELSIVNLLAKLLWAGGIVGALLLGYGTLGAGAAVVVTEVFRSGVLIVLARRHVALRLRVDGRATWVALCGGLPFYVTGMAQTIYARVDTSIMSFLAPEREVGWYGAASTLGGLSLMLSPVIYWVLLPLAARAATRTSDDVMLLARRANEFVLAVAFPTALFFYLLADEIVILLFGQSYAPSVAALKILAPTFILTYAAIIYSSILIRLERGWAVTAVSLGGMIISPTLNVILVPKFLAFYGDGGAGRAAATVLLVTETYTVIAMLILLGARAVDRRLLRLVGASIIAALIAVAADGRLLSLGVMGSVLALGLYVILVLASGAVDIRGGISLLRSLRRPQPAAD